MDFFDLHPAKYQEHQHSTANMASISNLSDTIASTLANLPPQDQIQDGERMQLLKLVEKLQTALEPPFQPLLRFCFSVWDSLSLSLCKTRLN